MRTNVAGLPEGIVGGVLQEFRPLGRAPFQQQRIGIGERSHAKEEVITIRSFEIKALRLLVQWIVGALREGMEEPEVLREKKRSIVMQVIAHEPVRDGRLR